MKKIILVVFILSIFNLYIFSNVFPTLSATNVFFNYVNSIGGKETWKNYTSEYDKVEVTSQGATQLLNIYYDNLKKRMYLKLESKLIGSLELGFDGNQYWMKSSYYKGYLPKNHPLTQLLSHQDFAFDFDFDDPSLPIKRLEDTKINNKTYITVEQLININSNKTFKKVYYFDPKTFLLYRTIDKDQYISNKKVDIVQTFLNYKKVDNKKIPFKIIVDNGIATSITDTIENKFNINLDESIFYLEKDKMQLNSNIENNGNRKKIIFDIVWKKINDSFWNPKFNGVNWKKTYEIFLPKALKTKNDKEFFDVLNDMLYTLGESHTELVEIENTKENKYKEIGSHGFEIRKRRNVFVITHVYKNTPAEKVGLKSGMLVLEINGTPPEKIYNKNKKDNSVIKLTRLYTALLGKPGDILKLKVQDGKKILNISFNLIPILNIKSDYKFYKKLNYNIGYINIKSFSGNLDEYYKIAFESLKNTRALIIDLRGNTGGDIQLGATLASYLFDKPGKLGTLHFRYKTTNIEFNGKKSPYKKPVFILIDEMSASTSEIFATALQELKRAKIIGYKSSGLVLGSNIEKISDKYALQYAIGNYLTPNGIRIEGKSITPDILINPYPKEFFDNNDPVLKKAIEYINATIK